MKNLEQINSKVQPDDLLSELNQIQILGGRKDDGMEANLGCNTWKGCGENSTLTLSPGKKHFHIKHRCKCKKKMHKGRGKSGFMMTVITETGDTVKIYRNENPEL